MITWIKIDKDNLPEEEVIAYGYQGNSLIGYLCMGQLKQVKCESDETELLFVTHYSLINKPNDD